MKKHFKKFFVLFLFLTLLIPPFALADDSKLEDVLNLKDMLSWEVLEHEDAVSQIGKLLFHKVTLKYPHNLEIGVVQIFVLTNNKIAGYRFIRGSELFIFFYSKTKQDYERKPHDSKNEKEIKANLRKYMDGSND